MNKNRKLLTAGILLLLFAAAKLAGLYWWKTHRQPAAGAQTAGCNITAGCTLPDGTHIVFSAGLGAKTPFDITLSGSGIRQAHISFAMKDMDMGFNRFDLKPDGSGRLTARGVLLPFCVSGRSDFIAQLSVDGRRFDIPFTAK